MGRRPIGERPMTAAERQMRHKNETYKQGLEEGARPGREAIYAVLGTLADCARKAHEDGIESDVFVKLGVLLVTEFNKHAEHSGIRPLDTDSFRADDEDDAPDSVITKSNGITDADALIPRICELGKAIANRTDSPLIPEIVSLFDEAERRVKAQTDDKKRQKRLWEKWLNKMPGRVTPTTIKVYRDIASRRQ